MVFRIIESVMSTPLPYRERKEVDRIDAEDGRKALETYLGKTRMQTNIDGIYPVAMDPTQRAYSCVTTTGLGYVAQPIDSRYEF